jgi:conserved domain protein|nr:MAG TPA: holin [Caudoviricetes sp.]
MKKFNFKKWVKAATVRAIKTMAQSAVALIGTSTLITEIDVKAVISAVILAGILSLLTSTAGLPEVSESEEE